MKDEKEAVFGCILGQAIGDALGQPVEFAQEWPKQVPDFSAQSNQFTDDTQMMVAIAEAMLTKPPHRHSADQFMEELSRRIVQWRHRPLGGSHRAPGRACLGGAAKLQAGKSWNESGGLSAKGNGSAMRSSVVGAIYHRDINMAWRVGCLTAVPTHNNLEPILCAGAVAVLCAASIQGLTWQNALRKVLVLIENWERTVPFYPEQVPLGSQFQHQNPWYTATHLSIAYLMGEAAQEDHEFSEWNGNDFAAVPATAAAIYFNTRYHNFREVTIRCAEWTLDSDTTTAISGAIAGSRFGLEEIPESWRCDVELSSYFHELAERVWGESQSVMRFASAETDTK